MEDTSWIKPQLDSLFAGKIVDMYLQGVIADKIKMFGGKLYKYYSFAPNDSRFSRIIPVSWIEEVSIVSDVF